MLGMTIKAQQLRAELSGLTAQDRAELARFLIQSLDETEEAGVQAAWDAELRRRAAEIEAGTVSGEPAEMTVRSRQ